MGVLYGGDTEVDRAVEYCTDVERAKELGNSISILLVIAIPECNFNGCILNEIGTVLASHHPN